MIVQFLTLNRGVRDDWPLVHQPKNRPHYLLTQTRSLKGQVGAEQAVLKAPHGPKDECIRKLSYLKI